MTLVKNAKLLDEKVVDIVIKDGVISEIGHDIKSDCESIDVDGSYVLPTLMDLNIRIRDNQLTQKNLDEIENRAIKAGITSIVLNCSFTPSVDNKTYLEFLYHDLKSRKVEFILNIKGLNSKNKLNNISILLKAGAKVISENSDISTNQIRRIIQYSKMHDAPLFIFCQNRELNENGVINEGDVSFELGLPGISKVGEISEVAKISSIAKYYNQPILFQNLTLLESIELAKQNKNSLVEVSLHHLLQSEIACKEFNTTAKINPPLRCNFEREKLLKALKDGKVDVITTLFSPQSITRKDLPFELAEFGIDEMEEFFPLLYTNLVQNSVVTLQKLHQILSENPKKILNQKVTKIEVGEEATFFVFNPSKNKVLENKNSLYHDEEINGKITQTFIKGVTYLH